MKNLDLNSYGVQEMDANAMVKVNGGFYRYILDWIIGEAISSVPEAMGCYALAIKEGGKTCTDMPSK